MADRTITEIESYDESVHLISVDEPVIGFDPDAPSNGIGISNQQAQALANRTSWLKARVGLAGQWDMSSGTVGPAAPANDYQSTHTATTVTPSATLTGSGPLYLAAASSRLIPLLSSGIASATITQPDYAAGDTIHSTTLLITNSSATASDIESLFSGSPPSGLYLAYIALSPYAAAAALGSVNDGTQSSESGASAAAGVVVHATIDYATGVVSAAVGSDPVFGTTNLDLAAIAANGDGLRLWAGVLSTSSSVVFGAGHATVDFSGYSAVVDATLPAGSRDGAWYEVTAGGYFHGKATRAGQYVKLINGKTDLIIVDTPAAAPVKTVAGVSPNEAGNVPLVAESIGAEVAGSVAQHVAANDPHGDRNYASGLLTGHLSASDPHGDRAFATGAIGAHTAASDPHGDRAHAAGLISSHAAATDPHGDRAYADSAVNTHRTATDPHGDRAYADAAIDTHKTALDPHGDRAYADTKAAAAETSAKAYADTKASTAEANAKTYADGLVTQVWKDQGTYSPASGNFPATGFGGAAIKAGFIWTISGPGTLPGPQVVNAGDTLRALTDAPGQTVANWTIAEANIGYVPFNAANVDTDAALGSNSDTRVPSQKAIKAYSDLPKASVWRIADGTDTTKKLALDLSAISTGTTRTLTMPNASVSLGYVPASFDISGGVVTMTGAGGDTLSFAVYDPAAIVTSSGLNLAARRVYRCSADTSSYTINLPAAPADGDWVVIKDTPLNKNSRIGNVGVITVNGGSNTISTSLATTWAMTGPSLYGATRFTYLLVWSAVFASWLVANLSPDQSYLTGGVKLTSSYLGSTKVTQLISQANASNRSVQFPDYDLDFTWYNSLPYRNTLFGTLPSGVNSVILAGSGHKATKSYQAVLCGISANADGLCPDDSAIYANRSTVYTGSKVTGYIGSLKGSSTGTAASSLVTSSNTKLPAYLTKPTGHHAVSIFECSLTMTTSAGAVWYGKRRIHVRWDGTTATRDVQIVGADWNPDTQTVTCTVTVSSGLLDISMANTTAAGGDTCYWQCTYEAHHNGG